jgi:hypothetical protein
LGREEELTEFMNAYGEKISKEEFDALLDEIVKAEFIRYKIHYLAKLSLFPLRIWLKLSGLNLLRCLGTSLTCVGKDDSPRQG